MTSRYPELKGLAGAVRTSVMLDGEIVCLDDNGKPDFAALWFGSSKPAVCFMAFDVLEWSPAGGLRHATLIPSSIGPVSRAAISDGRTLS